MEIEGSDGSKTRLEPGSTIQFGRGHGFNSTNRTVSRRHVTLQMEDRRDKPTVRFEVIGMNPIWVYSHKTGKVEIFRRFDHGEMENGDMFCVSAENPIWFGLKRIDFEEENEQSGKRELGLRNELAESIEWSSHVAEGNEELDTESVDLSNIDPIKEFGLVVIGHEFDGYPKKMIQDARSWEWYIEEHEEESEDDGDVEGRKEKKRRRKKKKKGKDDDDEEWTGESEEDKDLLLSKPRKVQKPLYSPRSRDCNRPDKDRKNGNLSGPKKSKRADEDDETLGGFIVDDVQDEEYEMDEDDDDDEDDFIEDEDEDEDEE